jgi:23S rRNA (adenine-N6)-dimethyltransferase
VPVVRTEITPNSILRSTDSAAAGWNYSKQINPARQVSTMHYNENTLNIEYSQNEIVNKRLIERLVNQSSIRKGDVVYDIGVGSGVISEALIKKGARVIAIEKDQQLYQKCKQKFINQDRFELYLDDFLIWEFPPEQKYKVFSNIPFFHTADIVNKLLFSNNPPEDCYLIIQKEAAEKYAGIPNDTLTSLLIKPLFWIDIIYHFRMSDFSPVPSVDVVLLQIERRRCQPVSDHYYGLYKDLIIFCREGADQTVKKSLKRLFTYSQLKQLSRLLGIDYRLRPTDLSFRQYLGIFQFYIHHNPRNIALIRGAEGGLRKQQVNRIKTHRTRRKRGRSSCFGELKPE